MVNTLGEAEERAREYEEALEKLDSLRVSSLREIWIEYDKQNDILYINFGKEEPDESIMIDDDIIVSIRKDRIVGISIYNFSRRAGIY